MTHFQPFTATGGRASKNGDTITGTLIVRPGLRLVSAEVVDGTFLVTTFEVTDETWAASLKDDR